ncbi:cyclase family protein [Thiotrichales bacterium 19S9-12]|nr:cyclase family protein [Thiotrichales bacterium 19S9-11]MCF6811855.1 cyclase family protein [Thiotrichales bacterium 19S9-12]
MKLGFKFIDLTHTLTAEIPTWNKSCGYKYQIEQDYPDGTKEERFRIQNLSVQAGIGTHIDAPSHCVAGARSVAELSLDQLIVPCIKIDVSKRITRNYQVTVADLISYESEYGQVPQHAFIVFYTGWSQHWYDKEKYHSNFSFPNISAEVADFLLDRNISGLGIDTLSPDLPGSGYPVHKKLLGKDKYIIENIANANKLPVTGAYTMALPIKGANLTEAPVRLIALLPQADIK